MKNAETAYRQGLKSALSVRDGTNNEIVYIESGEYPLEIRIVKQQLKFWTAIENIMNSDPNHYITKLVNTKYRIHQVLQKSNDEIHRFKDM